MTSKEAARKMMQVVCIAAGAIILAGVVYYRSFDAMLFGAGVVMTSACNVARIYLLNAAVEKAVEIETGKSAGNYMRGQYLLRFLLIGAVLVAAALISTRTANQSILWGAVAGVFTMQIAAYSLKFYYKKYEMPVKDEHLS
jgi:hypothetical protein